MLPASQEVDRRIASDSQQPCSKRTTVSLLQPLVHRPRNARQYFLGQIVSVRRLQPLPSSESINKRCINRGEFIPCQKIRGIGQATNQACTRFQRIGHLKDFAHATNVCSRAAAAIRDRASGHYCIVESDFRTYAKSQDDYDIDTGHLEFFHESGKNPRNTDISNQSEGHSRIV